MKFEDVTGASFPFKCCIQIVPGIDYDVIEVMKEPQEINCADCKRKLEPPHKAAMRTWAIGEEWRCSRCLWLKLFGTPEDEPEEMINEPK